ncbi:MAG: methylmalonyl-CoA epimerase [Propionibacteriales bacterium]|nr:methylmalonyl-CoA epimerase [Propionibacteriales bacterium]
MFPAGLITAVDHVGIAVSDLDEAVAFYTGTLGFDLVHEEVNDEQGIREAMVAIGSSGTCLQLMAPLTPDSTIARFLDRSGPGIQQLAYQVTSIEGAMDAARAEGLRLLYDEPRRGTAGSRINFIHPKDAGGVLVELVEPGRVVSARRGERRPLRPDNFEGEGRHA